MGIVTLPPLRQIETRETEGRKTNTDRACEQV